MKLTINISEENAKFLCELMDRFSHADNKGTGDPYYFCVRHKRHIAVPEGCGGETMYYWPESRETLTDGEARKLLEDLKVSNPHDYKDMDFDEFAMKNLQKFDCDYVDVDENFFLTLEGYEEHMRLNGHNYRHYKDTYPYLQHAVRNPEITSLLKSVKEIGSEIKKIGSNIVYICMDCANKYGIKEFLTVGLLAGQFECISCGKRIYGPQDIKNDFASIRFSELFGKTTHKKEH